MSKIFTEDVLDELIETSGLREVYSQFSSMLNDLVDLFIDQNIDEKTAFEYIFKYIKDDIEDIDIIGVMYPEVSDSYVLKDLENAAEGAIRQFNNVYFRQNKDQYEDALVNTFKRSVKEDGLLGSKLRPEEFNVLTKLQFKLSKGMKVLLNQVHKNITAKIENDELEYNPPDKLGKYAFPLTRYNELPYESNTKIEDRMERELEDHFSGDRTISAKTAEHMIDLKSRGQYKDIFNDTDASVIYRGMAIPFNGLLKLFDKKFAVNVLKKALHEDSYFEKSLTYKPRKIASSWTTEYAQALNFADQAVGMINSPLIFYVILHADPMKNRSHKFAGEGGLYKLTFTDRYQSEYEVMCIGDVKIKGFDISPAHSDMEEARDKILKLFGVDIDKI